MDAGSVMPGMIQADVPAVVAIADARDHFGDILFRETRVRAGIARFPTGITRGDTLNQDRVIR